MMRRLHEGTADLVFVKNPDRRNKKGHVTEVGSVFGRWEGGDVMEVSGDLLNQIRAGASKEFVTTGRNTYRIVCLNLNVRVVGIKVEAGAYRDTFLVMRDGLRARTHGARLNAAMWILRRVARAEAYIRDNLLRQATDGQIMPFAAAVASRIL